MEKMRISEMRIINPNVRDIFVRTLPLPADERRFLEFDHPVEDARDKRRFLPIATVGGVDGGYVDAGSPTVGGSRSWKSMEIEIQSLLEKLLDIIDSMSRCVASAAQTTSGTQKLARHRDILHEFTQEKVLYVKCIHLIRTLQFPNSRSPGYFMRDKASIARQMLFFFSIISNKRLIVEELVGLGSQVNTCTRNQTLLDRACINGKARDLRSLLQRVMCPQDPTEKT